MLKVFRDNLKYLSWILWVVIAVFILFVFANFGSVMPGSNPNTASAATVGEETITWGELQRGYRSLQDQFRQSFGSNLTPELMRQLRLEQRALENLVNRKIMLIEARRMGLTVSDEELSRAILEQFRGADGKFIGDDRYRSSLQRAGYSVQDWEKGLRHDLLVQKLFELLRQNLVVSDQEVEQAYRDQVEKASIRYIQAPASQFSGEVEVSDEEVASYFAEHRADYRLPERRAVSYLLVDLNQLRRDLPIDEGELYTYYQENEERFTQGEQVRARHILVTTTGRSEQEARRLIEDLRRRLERGEDFAALARESSEDPGSKAQGGELGFFGRGQMTPEFEQAAFNAQPGELAGPIQTPFGFHLVEVEERREGGLQPFPEVRTQIRNLLAAQRAPAAAEARAKELAAQLAEMNEVGAEQLQGLVTEGGPLVFAEPEAFSKDGIVPGLGRDQGFLDTTFALEPGELSEPTQVVRGWALIYLKEIQPPRDRELDEVREAVLREITRRKEKQAAVDRLADAKQRIDGGETLDAVAEAIGLTVQDSGEFGPRGPIQGLGANPRILQAVFAMDPGEVGGPFESAQGAVLLQVVQRTGWDPEGFALERDELRQQLEQQKLDRVLSSLVFERRRSLGVRYTRALEQELEASAQG